MSDRTQPQSDAERLQAQKLSLKRDRPPTEVPGYELRQFLGAGAYGEVWAGVDRNTGRQVAVKFYLHRGGVDWSLLSREVEKLVFLSADRYIVQLLEVGWDSDPPYYVMEYIENGSLEELLERDGPLPLGDAVELFQELATGLMHAHGKGVLHCDLKPANVLLDQDSKPRLADFGQSRLSNDQTPALGTLFYMAPEQADLEAVPDARWDVYALGAILYCLLTGSPPYRDDAGLEAIDTARNLNERLTRYREVLDQAPPLAAHRSIPGMDRGLAEIITRCLARDPNRRYPNVQEILNALRSRANARRRQPLMLLGIVGPLMLLVIMSLFGWSGYRRAMRDSEKTVVQKVREGNTFAAQAVSEAAAAELERYFRAVEQVATDPDFEQLLYTTTEQPELKKLLETLRDPLNNPRSIPERREFVNHSARIDLQETIAVLLEPESSLPAASWFACDAHGTQLASRFARSNATSTVGKNYGWRTYFHGGDSDLIKSVDGKVRFELPQQVLDRTHLSAPFQSTATNVWKVAISAPVRHNGKFVGIVAVTVDLGVFVRFFNESGARQRAVLVDGRPGQRTGMILQHPLYDRLIAETGRVPDRFAGYRVKLDELQNPDVQGSAMYADPVADDAEGTAYGGAWIAASAPVRRRGNETGLSVIVQEPYEGAVAAIHDLGWRLAREGLLALAGVICVTVGLWVFVLQAMAEPRRSNGRGGPTASSETPIAQRTTLPARR